MVAPERERSARARWLIAGLLLLVVAAGIGVVLHLRRGQAQGNEAAAILRLRKAVGIARHEEGGRPLVLSGYRAQIYTQNSSGAWRADGEPTRDLTAALDRKVRVYAWPDRFEVTGVRTLMCDPDAGVIYATYPRHPRSGGLLYEGKQAPPAVDAAYREGRDSPGSTPSQNDLPAGVRFDKQSSWDHAVPTRDGNIWLPVGG